MSKRPTFLGLAAVLVLALIAVPTTVQAGSSPTSLRADSLQPRAAAIFSGFLSSYAVGIDGEGKITIAYVAEGTAYAITSGANGKGWSKAESLGRGDSVTSVNSSVSGDTVIGWSSAGELKVSIRLKGATGWRSYVKHSSTQTINAFSAMVLPDDTTMTFWLDNSTSEGKVWTATLSATGVKGTPQLLATGITGAKMLPTSVGQPILFLGTASGTVARAYRSGTWESGVSVCACNAESAEFGGGGRYLLKTFSNTLAVFSAGSATTREYDIPSGRQIAAGGGRVFAAWSTGSSTDERSGGVYLAELDLESGRFTGQRTVASYNLDPGIPNAEWVRNYISGVNLVVAGDGQPTVAWDYSVWIKVDGGPVSSRTAPRDLDPNPYMDYYAYMASGEKGSPKLLTRVGTVYPRPYAGHGGTGVVLWSENLAAFPNVRLLAEVFGNSQDTGCVNVPGDGGPIQPSAQRGPRSAVLQTRQALRFFSLEAVGCFEPITEASHKWGKTWQRKGVWLNATDTTRINGIDILAPAGSILFDVNNRTINWLPGAEFRLGLQGKQFHSFKAPGTLTKPFSVPIRPTKTVLNIGTSFRDDETAKNAAVLPSATPGGERGQLLGMPVISGVGLSLEWGVEGAFESGGEGGYTQVRASLGFAGSFDADQVRKTKLKPDRPCLWSERNTVVKGVIAGGTGMGNKATSERFLRCEVVNPLDPDNGMRWKLLPRAAISPGISATFRSTNKSGLQLREVKGSIQTLALGPFALEDIQLTYTPATDTRGSVWAFRGSASFGFGKIGAKALRDYKATLGFSIQLVDPSKGLWDSWQLQGFTMGFDGAKLPTGGLTYITRFLGSVDYGDTLGGATVSASVTWAFGNPLPIGPESFDPLAIDATLTYVDATLPNPNEPGSKAQPARLTMQGTGSIFGMPLADLTAEAELAGSFPSAVNRLSFEAGADLREIRWALPKAIAISGSVRLVGFYDWRDSTWQFRGAVTGMDWNLFSLATGVTGGEVLFSDRGWAVCGITKNSTFGASGSWTSADDIVLYESNCDVGVMKSIPKSPRKST